MVVGGVVRCGAEDTQPVGQPDLGAASEAVVDGPGDLRDGGGDFGGQPEVPPGRNWRGFIVLTLSTLLVGDIPRQHFMRSNGYPQRRGPRKVRIKASVIEVP